MIYQPGNNNNNGCKKSANYYKPRCKATTLFKPFTFKTVNKNGQSNYYTGFAPDATIADGLDKNWGDVTESSLASAIKYITTGAFRLANQPAYLEQPAVTNANSILDESSFKGTIVTGKKL